MAGAPATAPQSGEPPVSLGGYSQFRAVTDRQYGATDVRRNGAISEALAFCGS